MFLTVGIMDTTDSRDVSKVIVRHRNDFLKFGNTGIGSKDGGDPGGSENSEKTALVVVNGKGLLHADEIGWMKRAWASFHVKVCADGGSNRLHDAFRTEEERGTMLPDHIIGDLDSARDEVLAYYRGKGVTVIEVPNQDNMDLEKSLDLLCELQSGAREEGKILCDDGTTDSSNANRKMKVVVIGAFGGRFDQEMANCNCLFRYLDRFESMVLLGAGNSVTLLKGGTEVEHLIEMIPGIEGPGCSLLPIGNHASSVTTSGLHWDVEDCPFHFGGMVSSSNKAAKEKEGGGVISVKTSHPLIWSCDLVL